MSARLIRLLPPAIASIQMTPSAPLALQIASAAVSAGWSLVVASVAMIRLPAWVLLVPISLHVNAAARQSTFSAGPHEGKDVPLTPRRTLSLRGEWEPSAEQQIDVLVNHVASQHPDFDNACRMPSYATLDLRYAYRWQHAELALGVTNAGDHKYYTQAFSCAAGEVGGIYPEAGRALTVSVRLAF